MNAVLGIKLEVGDRRYFVLEVDNPHKDKKEYYTPLSKQCHSQEAANEFLTMLYQMPELDEIDLRYELPMTDIKRRIILASMPSVQAFWYDRELKLNPEDRTSRNEFTATQLYSAYKDFCTPKGKDGVERDKHYVASGLAQFGALSSPFLKHRILRGQTLYDVHSINIISKITKTTLQEIKPKSSLRRPKTIVSVREFNPTTL